MADTQEEQEVIDWDEAPEWANWAAKDENGRVYWYTNKPAEVVGEWCAVLPGIGEMASESVTIPGPWRDSLRERPEQKAGSVTTGATAAAAYHDAVSHPEHYQSDNGIECIDAIQAALTPEEFRGYCKGNVIKYAWRERQKGGDESLRKARWHINRLLGDA